eukprot:10313-Amphidinium_carterae.1
MVWLGLWPCLICALPTRAFMAFLVIPPGWHQLLIFMICNQAETRRQSHMMHDDAGSPLQKARMTLGGSSTCPVRVTSSPEINIRVDTDGEFDLLLLGSRGILDVKMEAVNAETNVDCGDDIVDLNAVCAADKALDLVTNTEAREAIDEMTNKAGESKP